MNESYSSRAPNSACHFRREIVIPYWKKLLYYGEISKCAFGVHKRWLANSIVQAMAFTDY